MSETTTTTSNDAPTAARTVPPNQKSMEDIVSLCKRRGFVYPASEIYGGINGFWDYGPLGTTLKNNLRNLWWREMVDCPPDSPDGKPISIVGLDSAIIQNPKVWEASGHVGGFNDPMVDDTETKQRFRADQLYGIVITDAPQDAMFDIQQLLVSQLKSGYVVVHYTFIAAAVSEVCEFLSTNPKPFKKQFGATTDEARIVDDCAVVSYGKKVGIIFPIAVDEQKIHYAELPSPFTGKRGSLTEPRMFNLMFETFVGAIRDEENKAYLRPETAQGIFINYKNILDTMRVRVPFGIAQIGKSFRNEVTPRNFIFRSREFEQMEMEFFCHPDNAKTWYEFWVERRLNWWKSLGIDRANLVRREHDPDELAHYSTACADVEYQYPFTAPGFGELEGIAHRGDFDLTQHQKHAKTKLEYFDQERNERYIPHVIEPAAGLTRGLLVLLCEAYTPDESRPSKMFMRFDPRLAPIQAAVFPLVQKDGMPEVAEKLYRQLRTKFAVQMDVKQNIGKRYARMDEAGTPFCFTIDSDTLKDNTVTIRHRDTCAQERINIEQVETFLQEKIGGA